MSQLLGSTCVLRRALCHSEPGRRRWGKRVSVKAGGGTPAPLALWSNFSMAKS